MRIDSIHGPGSCPGMGFSDEVESSTGACGNYPEFERPQRLGYIANSAAGRSRFPFGMKTVGEAAFQGTRGLFWEGGTCSRLSPPGVTTAHCVYCSAEEKASCAERLTYVKDAGRNQPFMPFHLSISPSLCSSLSPPLSFSFALFPILSPSLFLSLPLSSLLAFFPFSGPDAKLIEKADRLQIRWETSASFPLQTGLYRR